MQLILLEKVAALGDLGEVVTVKPGYGRNFLVPQGKAIPATKANLEAFEARKEELKAKEQEVLNAALARRDAIADKAITTKVNASAEGRMYGSISAREIADLMTDVGMAVEKAEIILSEGALRNVGEYDITIRLHPDVECQVHLSIVSDDVIEQEQEQVIEAEKVEDMEDFEAPEHPEPEAQVES